MNYRVFRYLVIGSVTLLLTTLILLLGMLFSGALIGKDAGSRKLNARLQQMMQQIADNQDKLISGQQQVGQILNIPQQDYRPLPMVFNSEAGQTESPAGTNKPELLQKSGSSLEIAFYDALRYLDQNLQKEQAVEQLNQLVESDEWLELLKEQRLHLVRSEEVLQLFPDNDKLVPRGQAAPHWFELSIHSAGSNQAGKTRENRAKQSKAERPIPLRLQLTSPLRKQSYSSDVAVDAGLRRFIGQHSEHLLRQAQQYDRIYRFLTGRVAARQLAGKNLYMKSLQPATVQKVSASIKRTVEIAQTDWEVRTRDERVVARFHFDIAHYRLLWHDKEYQSLQLLESDWETFIKNVDTRTEGQLQEDQMREYLVKMLRDPAFLLQMENYGLRPAGLPPREDEYYEYYDLLDGLGGHMGSFALQKRVGETYLMDRDDVKIRGLKSFLSGAENLQSLFSSQEAGKHDATRQKTARNSAYRPREQQQSGIAPSRTVQNGSNWSNRGMEIVLLVGTHDNMADVIMLVAINKKSEQLNIFSLPRDLYYRGSKINAVYAGYGPGPFMELLSQITGLPIHKYISMDMYAFIEVVDLIGGVDVYLKEDLIDPSYKIKQLGRWETLVMRRGQHHLDGLGALRYSRSRHSSNDFERSERQQLILNQAAEKLRTQLSNPQKLLSFLQVVQKYMKTNFSTAGITRYWLKYGGYQRNFGNTISTDNVLYYTYTNYLNLSPEQLAEAREDEDFFRGSYILLPRGNDWGLIRQYILSLQNS